MGAAVSQFGPIPKEGELVKALSRIVPAAAGKAGIVDEFAVGAGGALTAIGSVAVPGGAGGEGIAAA